MQRGLFHLCTLGAASDGSFESIMEVGELSGFEGPHKVPTNCLLFMLPGVDQDACTDKGYASA